jgi:predicted metal-dependent HD superfamily phosphohydrolase
MGVTLDAFAKAVSATGAEASRATVAAVHAEFLARWASPGRHYHTVAHLAATLSLVDDPVVALALWGHDAVYDPRATGFINEERSAVLTAGLLARCGSPPAVIREVMRLVRLTAGHSVAPGDTRGAALADADLAILAAPPPAYDSYVAAVRAEYAHVPDDLWRLGRGAVLRKLLDHPQLFHNHPEWEPPARANLTRELTTLA